MSLLHLYYATGVLLILTTIALSYLGILSYENMMVFGLAGILLLALGIVQHILLLYEK